MEIINAHKTEAETMAPLSHPNIVKNYDYFHDPTKGEIYNIMEYVEGMDVLEYLAA